MLAGLLNHELNPHSYNSELLNARPETFLVYYTQDGKYIPLRVPNLIGKGFPEPLLRMSVRIYQEREP